MKTSKNNRSYLLKVWQLTARMQVCDRGQALVLSGLGVVLRWSMEVKDRTSHCC